MRRSISSPSISGISMSSVTRDGLSCGIRCNPMTPFGAAPTTSIAASSSRACVTRRRMTTESSTTSTRIRSPGCRDRWFTAYTDGASWINTRHLQLLHQDFLRERLHNVLVRACLERGRHLIHLRFGGDHHDGRRAISGFSRRRLSNSKPFTSGIFQSASTSPTESFWFSISSSASLPFAASRTSYPSSRKVLARIMRTAFESSTTSALATCRLHSRQGSERELRNHLLKLRCHLAQLLRGFLRVACALRRVLRRQRDPADVLRDIADSFGCLSNAAADFVGRRRLLFDRRGDAVRNIVDLVNNGADLLDCGDRALGIALDGLDFLADVFGGLRGLLREFLHFVRYHGEALAGFARPRRFDGRV